MLAAKFPTVDECVSIGRDDDAVVANLEGALLRGTSSFPYFALLAFETGGPLRLLLLLLLSPIAAALRRCVSDSAGIRVLIFAAFAGARLSDIESAARAVLPKFYSGDLHPDAWRVFSSCRRRRCVVTASPRIMAEPFAKEFLVADSVVGTELSAVGGRATGLVKPPGVLVGRKKAEAVMAALGGPPEIGLGGGPTDFPFMSLCKESYTIPRKPEVEPLPVDKLPRPIIFHDGRLVRKPTPFGSLLVILWIPIGFLLACLRMAAGALLPMRLVYYAFWGLGVRVVVKGAPPPPVVVEKSSTGGVLFICSHRTLLDPIFLSAALGRPIPAVTYSVSRLSELISPIKTVRLSRDRATDAAMIKKLLRKGDLAICPEGTTGREPFLLRFSSLFAELTDELVPVAMVNRMSMFHGTTARGWKGMDPFYFFMNPSPAYEVTFLNKLPKELTCGAGKSSNEVANYIQRVLASTLSYECTTFTRKDKYNTLAGNDGSVVVEKSRLKPNKD